LLTQSRKGAKYNDLALRAFAPLRELKKASQIVHHFVLALF